MKRWLKQVAIAFDQLLNAFFFGGYADETISARAHRCAWRRAETAINWLFRDPQHCLRSYQSELLREQLPKSYRATIVEAG